MTITLESVSGSAGGSWSDPGNAAFGDAGAYATNASGMGWIEISFPAPDVPLPEIDEIDGILPTLNAGLIASGPPFSLGPEEVATLEMQFSVNGGSSWVGSVQATEDMNVSQLIAEREIGSPTDLWGRVWLADEINSGDLMVRVRRPSDVSEATVQRLLESVSLEIYSTTPELTMRIQDLQKCVIGNESSYGGGATPNLLLRGSRFQLQPVDENEEIRAQGMLVPIDYIRNVTHSAGSWNSNGKACFNDIGLPLASILGIPTSSTLATGVYRHEFDLPVQALANPRSYAMIWGDSNGAEKVLGCLVNGFTHEFGEKKTSTWSGNVFGQALDSSGVMVVGVNDVQTITVTGTPTAGTFKLRFKGAITSALAFDISGAALQTALQALATIGASNATVSGSGPYVVTFAAALAGENQPLIELDTNSLTGGSTPSVTIVHTTPGGIDDLAYQPIMANHTLYQASTYAGLSAGELTQLYTAKLDIANRYTMETFQNDNAPASFDAYAEDGTLGVNMDFMVAESATAIALEAAHLARTNKFLKSYCEGPVIASAIPYSLTIEMACKVQSRGNYQASPGGKVVTRSFVAGVRFDEDWGHALKVVLVNTKATY